MLKLVLKASFKVGTAARAKRNVFAEGMIEGESGVSNPYAVATAMVKKGNKPAQAKTKKALKKEKKRQKKEAKQDK